MNRAAVINGISAIYAVNNAYQELSKDVKNIEEFEQVICDFIENICVTNHDLLNTINLGNCETEIGELIGSIHLPFCFSDSVLLILEKYIPKLVHDKSLNANLMIDCAKSFSMVLNIDAATELASTIAQNILISMLKINKSLHIRCADLASGGNFFTSAHKLLTSFPSRTGGKVYTQTNEFAELIETLDKASFSAMSKLGATYSSVEEYNKENNVKINEFISIIYLNHNNYLSNDMERLRILIENGRRNGMSFIIVGTEEATEFISDKCDYILGCFDDSSTIGYKEKIPFEFEQRIKSLNHEIDDLVITLQESEQVDTRYENHPELYTDYFGMDSSDALRIPFAIDKNNMPVYFEIGGNAPTHALIAGSTGSGKSVALHTLIMQIVRNYHPDDVEIWAIDYKAVEFASYMDHRTPHFRVIAHDTSNEFSLSLIDLLYKEYEQRQREFLKYKVKNINQYRQVCGKHSMPRIIAVIDEFQLMTQAVQDYTGNVDYRTKLENILRLTRAMGISLILCSQTIASGLSGLSDAARDQIGCRLCLKHDDDMEIRETLVLSGENTSEVIKKAKELRRGQGIYKRARWANEHAADGKAYEFLQSYILYINDDIKSEIIDKVNNLLENNYVPKEEILVRGDARIEVIEKNRHPLMRFINSDYEPDDECIELYPAAPTTLDDFFRIDIENTASANILLVGEEDNLRESIILHSICGFLMNSNTKIIVNVFEEQHPKHQKVINQLEKIECERLTINKDIHSCLASINDLKRIRPTPGYNTVYVWYGLEKLKNEIFLMNQDKEDSVEEIQEQNSDDLVADLMSFLSEINNESKSSSSITSIGDELSFENCQNILKQAIEVGPENNKFNFVVFHNRKSMKKTGMIDLENFENRIGSRMSMDDSYELFNSSMAINKTDENTVIYYSGSGQPIPLRPYLIPNESWFKKFNSMLRKI